MVRGVLDIQGVTNHSGLEEEKLGIGSQLI